MAQTASFEYKLARTGLVVEADTFASLTMSAAELVFSPREVSTSDTRVLTLHNSGTAPLLFTAPLSYVGSGAFSTLSASSTCVEGLEPGASCQITIRFRPLTEGEHTATLSVATNAGPVQTVALSGQGLLLAGASLSATSLSFGNRALGSSDVRTVTLSSTKDLPLLVSSVTQTGSSAFDVSTSCSDAGLNKGQSCLIQATFAPLTTGAHSGSIQVRTNDAAAPLRVVSMSGAGQAALGALTAPQGTAFGTTLTTIPVTRSFTFQNIGNVSATGVFPVVSGDGFSLASSTCGLPGSPVSLVANGSCTFTVQFLPSSFGLATGSVSVSSSAFGEPQALALSGNGAVTHESAFVGRVGVQQVDVLESGTYYLEARGAQGGQAFASSGSFSGGLGARVICQVELSAGQRLKLIVGLAGSSTLNAGSGGGGAFVALADNTPLCVAGGGAGAPVNANGAPGLATFSGNGQGGVGTLVDGLSRAAGGGGFYTDGGDALSGGNVITTGGKSFVNAGAAGRFMHFGSLSGSNGGFGGGGPSVEGATGAGGGYNGGVGGWRTIASHATGGTSFSAGTVLFAQSGANAGHGRVIIHAPSTSALSDVSSVSLTRTTGSGDMQAYLDESVRHVYTVRNESANIPLTDLSFSLSGSPAFSISANTCTASLAPNASCLVTVSFEPQAVGSSSATLTVNSSATDGAQSVVLQGNGLVFEDPNLASVTLLLGQASVGTSLLDESSAGTAITTVGAVTSSSAQSRFGPTSVLLGANSYIRADGAVAQTTSTTTPFTMEAWTYQTSSGTARGIFALNSKAAGANTVVLTNTRLTVNGTNVSFSSGTSAVLNEWIHLAVSFDGTTVRAFRNGQLVASRAVVPNVAPADSVLGIGTIFGAANGGSPASYFPGHLDDIRVTMGVARYVSDFTPQNAPAQRP